MVTKLCDAFLGLSEPPHAGQKVPFQVAHFSDIHINRQYALPNSMIRWGLLVVRGMGRGGVHQTHLL